jgi:hypothetical protein
MRTVKWLRDELAKFPDDAVCWAYEAESSGIVISRTKEDMETGFIYCSEDGPNHETELLPRTFNEN